MMCTTCGCGTGSTLINGRPLHRPHRHGGQMHFRAYDAIVQVEDASAPRIVKLEQDILAKNNGYAEANRATCRARHLRAQSGLQPRSGKTTLLVKTIAALNGTQPLAVIEGDQQTENDAARIRAPVRRPSRSTPARAATWTRRWSARPYNNWVCRKIACY